MAAEPDGKAVERVRKSPWRATVAARRAEALPTVPPTGLAELLASPVTSRFQILFIQRDLLRIERWIAEWLEADARLEPESALTPESLRTAAAEVDEAMGSGEGSSAARPLHMDRKTLRLERG